MFHKIGLNFFYFFLVYFSIYTVIDCGKKEIKAIFFQKRSDGAEIVSIAYRSIGYSLRIFPGWVSFQGKGSLPNLAVI
jgi:hypothetical protein